MCDSSERDTGSGGKQLDVKLTVRQYCGEAFQTRVKDSITVTGNVNEHYGEFLRTIEK